MRLSTLLSIASALGVAAGMAEPAFPQDLRKNATDATRAANQSLLNQLPFSDRTDFKNAHRGFVAPLPTNTITGEGGKTLWNPEQFSFIREDAAAPDSVNPSLWRQSQLTNISGLFEVTDGIYQVRNQDLSNMTIIEGNEGIVVVDPLVSAETARVAIDLYYANRGRRPLKAVIYTHSHVDHYGGVRGIVDEADVTSGNVKIYAPDRLHRGGCCREHLRWQRHESPSQLHVWQSAAPGSQGPGWRGARNHHVGWHRYADPADRPHQGDRRKAGRSTV